MQIRYSFIITPSRRSNMLLLAPEYDLIPLGIRL